MKYFFVILFGLLYIVHSKACLYLEASWSCKGPDGTETTVVIDVPEDAPTTLTETKMGIKLDPLIIDGQVHQNMDSRRVKMNYKGECLGEDALSLQAEQIFFGALKSHFAHDFELVDKMTMKMTITDRKPNKPPISKEQICTR